MSPRTIVVAVSSVVLTWTTVLGASPASATYPGRNGEIVFGSITDSGRQLFTVDEHGHRQRQVTHIVGADAAFPDWSPSGRRIVFDRETADSCSVMVMRADGSHVRDLSRGRPGCEQNAAFTPDGRHLVFVAQRCQDCMEGIWLMDLHGHQRHLITPSPAGQHSKDPNVSPDGRKLGFIAEDEQNRASVYVVDLVSHRRRQVVPPSYDVSRKLDWSPDSRRILFSDNANETDLPANLATVRPDGGGLRFLTHHTDASTRAFAGSYSPDGRWVVARLESARGFTLARVRIRDGRTRQILQSTDTAQTGSDWGAEPPGSRGLRTHREQAQGGIR